MKLDLYQVKDILFHGGKLSVEEHMDKVEKSYAFLQEFAKDKLIYGINTGFGPMAQWRVDDKSLIDLQYNIIRSHSTGMGEALSEIDVKAAMIARLGSLIQGKSGVYPYVVELLSAFIENDIIPFVPRHGSVGASGDLVQLAHIALCLIGEGKVHYKGEWCSSKQVMQQLGLKQESIVLILPL